MTDDPTIKPDETKSAPAPGASAEPPKRSALERRSVAATDVLRTLLRDLYASRFGAVLPAEEEIELSLRLRVRPGEGWATRFEPAVEEQLGAQFEDAQAGRDIYVRGRVFCFRCGRSDCEHSRPPSPLSVFVSFDSTGRPEWSELAQSFLAAKDPRVDQLFVPGSAAHALVQLGHQLRGGQLSTFGRTSKTYAILGQVVAGYFRCSPAPEDRQDLPARVAVTLQIVEARGAGGIVRIHLNAIAALPDGGGLETLLGSGWEPSLYRAKALCERHLEEIERQVAAARQGGRKEEARELMRRVPGLLHRLADSIERGERQEHRRTRHVEDRRREQRPVHKAIDDVVGAAAESFFHDEKAKTLVVCGHRGRAHAFSPGGRHVTSFNLKPGAVEFRLRTQRWRPATPEEIAELRQRIREAQGG
jgi:hypothetical protein